jgi:hypothetical protein
MRNANKSKQTNSARVTASEKSGTRKKTTSRTKTAGKKDKVVENRSSANSSKQALVSQLRRDLKATKEALKSVKMTASKELKLAKKAAKDEIAVVKDQLAGFLKREEALIKMSQNKTREMIAAGGRWEKQQLHKIKKLTSRAGKK